MVCAQCSKQPDIHFSFSSLLSALLRSFLQVLYFPSSSSSSSQSCQCPLLACIARSSVLKNGSELTRWRLTASRALRRTSCPKWSRRSLVDRLSWSTREFSRKTTHHSSEGVERGLSCVVCFVKKSISLLRSTHWSALPAKRLWVYLVHREVLFETFVRYIFRRARDEEVSASKLHFFRWFLWASCATSFSMIMLKIYDWDVRNLELSSISWIFRGEFLLLLFF